MGNLIHLAVMDLNEAKTLKERLLKEGIELVLNHDGATCTRGCRVTVEVSVAEKDFQKTKDLMAQEHLKNLEGHDYNFDLLNNVFDPSSEWATCPACGTVFSTGLTICPECELSLA